MTIIFDFLVYIITCNLVFNWRHLVNLMFFPLLSLFFKAYLHLNLNYLY